MGHNVICVDNDERKVAALQGGDTLIHEDYLPELLERYRNNGIRFTTDLGEAHVQSCEAIFIAVGTPQSETGDADLSYVEAVACEIARRSPATRSSSKRAPSPSTPTSGSAAFMERNGVARDLFDVVSNPEFLREGTAVADFLHPDRIVVGANSERAAAVLAASTLRSPAAATTSSPTPSPACCSAATRLRSCSPPPRAPRSSSTPPTPSSR
jgi:UDPglucose 6-dehydrogenase